MNKVLNNYIVKNYLIIVFNATLLFTCMVILLNLFQEIEFFKDLDVSFETPLVLTLNVCAKHCGEDVSFYNICIYNVLLGRYK